MYHNSHEWQTLAFLEDFQEAREQTKRTSTVHTVHTVGHLIQISVR